MNKCLCIYVHGVGQLIEIVGREQSIILGMYLLVESLCSSVRFSFLLQSREQNKLLKKANSLAQHQHSVKFVALGITQQEPLLP